jgi:osmotically inducible lipoprotein OsmB
MKRLILGSIAAIAVAGVLGGCSMSKQTQGTIAGGAVGGVAGYALGGGAVGTVLGAAGGAFVGNKLSADN